MIDTTGTWIGTDVQTWGGNDYALVNLLNKLPIGSYKVSYKGELKTLQTGYSYGNYGLYFRAVKADSTQYNVITRVPQTNVAVGDIWNFEGTIDITSDIVGRFTSVFYYTGRNPSADSDTVNFYDFQIELGNYVTNFEQYNGNTFNISDIENLVTFNGLNNIFADIGDCEVTYLETVGKAIS